MEELVSALEGSGPEPAQARVPLAGEYELLYSAAKGGSNGKVGPFTGVVTQIISDEASFINQVVLWGGALTVQLHARREVLDDERIRVDFVETSFQLFGREVSPRGLPKFGAPMAGEPSATTCPPPKGALMTP